MSQANQIVNCDQLPRVAVEFMNTVHCEELALTQELIIAIKENEDLSVIDGLFDDWLEHTRVHFAREERLMNEYGFPPRMMHEGEHVSALENMHGVRNHWAENRDSNALLGFIEKDWWSWLVQHISTMDMVTANFLSQFDVQVDLERE